MITTKKKIFRNINWLFFDRVIRLFGGLLIGIWLARYLGPNDFGVLNYALAYSALFTVFVKLGLDQIVVREVVEKNRLSIYILGTSFVLKLIGSLIAILCVYISLYFTNITGLEKLIVFVIAISFVFQSLDVVDYFYQSQMLSKYVVIARNSAFVLSSSLKIYFIVNEFSVVYFAFSYTVDFFLASVFLVFIYKKTGYNISKWRFSKKIALRLLKFSWPLALCVFLVSIHTKVDQIMIREFLGVGDVGLYSVAVRLAEFWYFVPAIFVSTLMPYFVALKKSNFELYHARLLQLYSLMFWMGVVVGIFVTFYGEYIIILLYGEVYADSYQALVFNVWNGIFISQALARGIWLVSENLQLYRLYTNLVIVVMNVVMNVVMIPKYGIAGAAMATFLTQFLGTWLVSLFWKPLRESTIAMIKSTNPLYMIRKV